MAYQPEYTAYGAQGQAVVVVNQPMPRGGGQPQNLREWDTGLCACGEDCSSCCYAWWCFPCFLCSLSSKMGEFPCGPYCCGTFYHVLHQGIPNPFLTAMRTKLRTMHGVRGSICKDTCAICCCVFCATTQMDRQFKHFAGSL